MSLISSSATEECPTRGIRCWVTLEHGDFHMPSCNPNVPISFMIQEALCRNEPSGFGLSLHGHC